MHATPQIEGGNLGDYNSLIFDGIDHFGNHSSYTFDDIGLLVGVEGLTSGKTHVTATMIDVEVRDTIPLSAGQEKPYSSQSFEESLRSLHVFWCLKKCLNGKGQSPFNAFRTRVSHFTPFGGSESCLKRSIKVVAEKIGCTCPAGAALGKK
ncbi:hypothetical protein ACLOJK_006292, partial [Asimina triloba]